MSCEFVAFTSSDWHCMKLKLTISLCSATTTSSFLPRPMSQPRPEERRSRADKKTVKKEADARSKEEEGKKQPLSKKTANPVKEAVKKNDAKKSEVSPGKADSKSPAKRPEDKEDRKKRATSQPKATAAKSSSSSGGSAKAAANTDDAAHISPPRR